jgi:hemoglobin
MYQSTAGPASAPEPVRSPYQIIGGTETVRRVVERIYSWISLDDKLWQPYFAEVNAAGQMPNLKAHMTEQLCQILGGPKTYSLRDLAAVHQPLGITPEAYQRVGNYVLAALLPEHPPWEIVLAVRDVLIQSAPVIVKQPGT